MDTDIHVTELEVTFADEHLRTPLKFGTGVVSAVTSATVRARVETRSGRAGEGYGHILLSDMWGYPSATLSHEARDQAMRLVTERWCRELQSHSASGHPLDLWVEAKEALPTLARGVTNEVGLAEPMPLLGALVCASPADAALHDAFGQAHGLSAYDTYGPEFMTHDLGAYLGPALNGRYPRDYLRAAAEPELPIFHLVGGLDKLTRAEVTPDDPQDGLPVALTDWIERDGLRCLKVKLTGKDLGWDVQRTADVARVAEETRRRMGADPRFYLSVDSNELNDSPESVVEYLQRLRQASPLAYEALLYVEQPTERDLTVHRFDMRPVAALKPVVADEGITDVSRLDLAAELGWTGVGLKTCKGHSSCLLYIARARELGMVCTVQDLTNPGRSLVHSAGLAARTETLMGFEYNSRQYLPQADPQVRARHADLFTVRGGTVRTGSIGPVGLGY